MDTPTFVKTCLPDVHYVPVNQKPLSYYGASDNILVNRYAQQHLIFVQNEIGTEGRAVEASHSVGGIALRQRVVWGRKGATQTSIIAMRAIIKGETTVEPRDRLYELIMTFSCNIEFNGL